MKLIPAIDLMNGKCVRLFKGDFNKRKDFSREPYEQAKYWEKRGRIVFISLIWMLLKLVFQQMINQLKRL